MRVFVPMSVLLLAASCGPPPTYVPPAAPTASFSRELNASYDQVWSAMTNAAGANFFRIKHFEKVSGLMTLDYPDLRSMGSYVDCGSLPDWRPLNPVNPISGTQPTSALNAALIWVYKFELSGTGNITVRAVGPKKTVIQINSQYDLLGFEHEDKLDEHGQPRLHVAYEWKFTTGDLATQRVGFYNITCRPSYKIEEDFLKAVSARL